MSAIDVSPFIAYSYKYLSVNLCYELEVRQVPPPLVSPSSASMGSSPDVTTDINTCDTDVWGFLFSLVWTKQKLDPCTGFDFCSIPWVSLSSYLTPLHWSGHRLSVLEEGPCRVLCEQYGQGRAFLLLGAFPLPRCQGNSSDRMIACEI